MIIVTTVPTSSRRHTTARDRVVARARTRAMTLAMTHHPVARVVRRAPHRLRIARRSVVPAATSAFSRGDDDAFDADTDRARRVDARRARERTVKIRTFGPRSPYDELGVARDATPTEIKIAFRARAKATHPDAEGGDVTGEAFRRACAAHEVLMDDARRMMIDDGIVDRAGGFEWVEGEIRTTLDGARRSAKTKKKRTETAKKATPWDEKVMPSPENRESILRAWYFRRFQTYWRRWCEAWLGFLSVGAPLGVAAAGFYAAGFIDVDVDIDTVVAHLRAHDLSTFLSSLGRE